ncbi:MAG: glycosyltransferase family 1 protein [Lachnospiraceae bacterium]|nr:glycosyltransferase family 1 protein [Lachnospiraceae bacterium]
MNIILFKNTTESLEFFSFELARYFTEAGHNVFFYNCMDPEDSFRKMQEFIVLGDTAAFAFNFNGMMNDECLCRGKEPVFWNESGIPYVNMAVDHPYYYHEEFAHVPENYRQISIDKGHREYMRRFFPEINSEDFLELGGTDLSENRDIPRIPFKERKYDLVFTGHYVPPDSYEKCISHCEKVVIDFYHGLCRHLISHPDETLEYAAENMIKEAFGDRADDEYLKKCFENMIFIDLQVRHYFRGEAVKALCDAGFEVHVFGSGYEALPLKRPEKLISHGGVDSLKCLEALAQSRAALNVMPWFKDGGHDRVYNTMLNGALSLSDPSRALREHFTDRRDILFFDLKHIDEIPEVYGSVLKDPELLMEIAGSGNKIARESHSWRSRADAILEILKNAI